MKLLVLTAIIAVVATNPILDQSKGWPWQVGKEYRYEVDSYTWTKLDTRESNGNALKCQFVVHVLAPGHLMAKVEFAKQGTAKDSTESEPNDVVYKPLENIYQPFEIFTEEGRVVSLNLPTSLSVEHENLLKALVSSLQVDLSTPDSLYNYPYSYDKEAFQGLFKRYEEDVTGHCETLYSVSPTSNRWRREIPLFATEKNPIEVTKTKNYGSCMEHIGIQYGLPDGYVWHGIATNNEEKQLIKHTYESRMLVGMEGTIYMSETSSSASVSPLLFGKQKSEVKTYTKFYLISVDTHNSVDWKMTEDSRPVTSLMYKLDPSSFLAPNEKHVAKAQKLLQEITPLLLQPNDLPKADFLSKFSILVDILSYMDSEELALMTSSIEVAKTSKNVAKNNMWIIYRDAIAQAGTEEAFKEIKSWIMNKKIQGDEAAQVLSPLAAGFYETTDIAPEFFNLAFTPEVQEQLFLNTSALLAASRVIRHSDNHTFILNDVIPRFSKELKQAIENGDSNKAQVYIRALGNLAQTEILQVFAPYLEGKVTVSNYLRRQMVISLKNLANVKDQYARAVLYTLLVNTAEPYEIRVAAALNIFMAYPTPEMFQRFAVMINFDPSTQVRAVLATSISYLASLKDPRFMELTKTAKSIMSTMPKDPYGYVYSADNFLDIYTEDDELTFWRELSNIGSEDSIYSSYDRNALRFRSSALSEESEVTLSLTSVQQLFNYMKEMLFAPDKSKPEFKFSAKKIGELLNIKPKHQEPLAGELFVENLNQQKLIPFNENDIKSFIKGIVKNVELTADDNTFHFTKILNKREVVAIFPLATGMPFVFEYTEPILLMAQGQVKLNFDNKANFLSGSLDNNIEITLSKNLQGSVGFLNTLTKEHISTGVVNKFQVYAPLKLEVATMITDYKLKISFLHPEQDNNLLHFSVSPYSAIQMKDSPLTVLEDPATKLVQRLHKVVSTDITFGHGMGMYYHLQGYSYSSDYKNVEKILSGDILTDFGHLLYQKDVALTHYDFTYLAESTNKVLALNLFVDTLYDQNFEGELAPATLMEDITADSIPRRLEITERAARGIKSAEVQVFDLSAVFEGPENFEWLFTAALAESHVDSKYQAALFMYGQEQMNMVLKINKPKMVPLNFEEALKSGVKVTYEADLKYGNASNINLKGYGERTETYKKQLLADPEAKKCLIDVKVNNLYLMDCYKMIIKAHTPDFFKTTVTYNEDFTPNTDIFLLELFSEWLSDIETFSWGGVTPKGTMEMKAQAYYYDNYVKYEFNTVYGTFHMKNVEAMEFYPYAMSFYEPLTSWEHFWNYLEGYQYLPYCAVDDNQIWTFGGRRYYYSLSSSWHVVMVDEGKQPGRWTDLVILARRPSEHQEEVYISYKSQNGKHLEVEIKPTEVKVKSNTKEITKGPLTMYWDEGEEAPFFEYYEIAPGVKVFDIENGGIRLMYDNHRLVIFTDQHRSFTQGICGRSTGQDQDDYLTPWGVVALPEHYGASWALEGEFSDSKTVELKKEAKLKAYEHITKYTTFLRYQDTNKFT